jgi:hypothetical protein
LERREENSCRVKRSTGTCINSEIINTFGKFPVFQSKVWRTQQQNIKAEALGDYSELSGYEG